MSILTAILIFFAVVISGMRTAKAEITVSFSPKGNCETMEVDLIRSAERRIDVAIYALNNENIVKALENAKLRGVAVRIVMDHVEAGSNREVTLRLSRDHFNFKLHSVNRIMHDKFTIVDDKRLETGSFNYTTPAQGSNAENCLVLDDKDVVKSYGENFVKLWTENTQEKSEAHLAKIREQEKKEADGL